MKITVDKELEDAHKQYEKDKRNILLDLAVLNQAMLDMVFAKETMTTEHFEQFNEIIARTMKFITEGERI